MKFQINLGKLIGVGILVIIPTLANPLPAAACEPVPPEPWFVESLRIQSAEDLPIGIRFTEQNNGKILSLYNPNEITLYILEEENEYYSGNLPSVTIEIPEGYVARYYLVSGEVFEWEIIKSTETGDRNWIWDTVGHPDPETLKLSIYDNQLLANWILILPIEPLNRVEDNRPESVNIPEPQIVLLPLIYGHEFLEIPVEISYALNPEYVQNGVEIASKACQGIFAMYPMLMIVGVVIAFTGVILALGYWIIFGLYRKQQKTINKYSE